MLGARLSDSGGKLRHGLPVAFHRVVLPQRMAFPVIGHHDALQVGMSGEAHAKQIEYLTLIKIG